MKYWTTLKKTYDALLQWSDKSISPGMEGGLSPVYPRVWTFELRLTNAFIQEVGVKLSGKPDSLVGDCLANDGELLNKLVIDEYLNRLRVHRWLVSESNGSRYDMFDIDKSCGGYWDFDKHKGCQLWAYETSAMSDGELSLSCSWERDPAQKRPYLQLILWLHCWDDQRDKPARDIVFKIPLEPGRLCDEEGKLVYVQGQGGREFKAGDLELFPYDEDNWKSSDDAESPWRWYLHMKTFHSYL